MENVFSHCKAFFMTAAVSGHGNTAHSAAQPLRLWFGLPVAIGQASKDAAIFTQVHQDFLIKEVAPELENLNEKQIIQKVIEKIKIKYPKLEKTSMMPKKFFQFLKEGWEGISPTLKTKLQNIKADNFDSSWINSF